MPIRVNQLFNQDARSGDEVRQAANMARVLSEWLPPDAEGNVYVLPNMVCPTAKNKDLDLVLWFDTPHLTMEIVTGVQGDTYPTRRQVSVRDALIILEVKSHNTYHSVRIQNQALSLQYPDGWKNATEQSNGQKHALIVFLKDKTGSSPFVVNLIWLFAADGLQHHDAHQVENILWGYPTLKRLFDVICQNHLPVERDGAVTLRASFNDEIRNATTAYFEVLRKNSAIGLGRISRKKVYDIIQRDVAEMEKNYFNAIGERLILFTGNPGTGKTVHLVHLAHNLLNKRDKRTLLLTFNKALEQDIKRLLRHSGLGGQGGIAIMTWDSFAFRCLSDYEEPRDGQFEEWTTKLGELVDGETTKNDFKAAKDFDCVMIDEGQDWSELKVAIIYGMFGHRNAVVSLGPMQYVERVEPQNKDGAQWKNAVHRDERSQYHLDTSHRNKTNVVSFLDTLGKAKGFDWELTPNNQLVGGRVIVTNGYTYELHQELVTDLQENENSFYDMMFLSGTEEGLNNAETLLRGFGHGSFVASRSENRQKEFPIDRFRVISYQACRGLEGWTVVCLEWDTFMEQTLSVLPEEQRQQAISSYTFIALTRAIDTLVITLRDPGSALSQELMAIVQQMAGTCELRVN